MKPDPTKYTPKLNSYMKQAPSFKIGNGMRSSLNTRQASLTPGPDKYNIKSQIWDRPPRFHIGELLHHDDKIKYIASLPGPNHYHTESSLSLKSKPPLFSMGRKLKQTLVKTDDVPGPGTYTNRAVKLKIKAPSFGFGTSLR